MRTTFSLLHPILGSRVAARLRNDDGLTTAEYAVGTIAAAGLGGLLLKLLTSTPVRDLLWSLISGAFSNILG
jgi:hypothetical protein